MYTTDFSSKEKSFVRGFPVGFHLGQGRRSTQHFIYNHLKIIIQTHDDDGGFGNGKSIDYLHYYIT